MERQYWAQRGNMRIGPYPSREQAEIEGQSLFPKRPSRTARVMIGYGTTGPSFDIRFIARKGA